MRYLVNNIYNLTKRDKESLGKYIKLKLFQSLRLEKINKIKILITKV